MCDACNPETHETKPLLINGEEVQIDCGIYELVSRVCSSGLPTVQSCQNDPRSLHEGLAENPVAYLGFAELDQACQFLRTAGQGRGARRLATRVESLDPRKNPSRNSDIGDDWFVLWVKMPEATFFLVYFPVTEIPTLEEKFTCVS